LAGEKGETGVIILKISISAVHRHAAFLYPGITGEGRTEELFLSDKEDPPFSVLLSVLKT
jgi:hypothetical protein